MKIDDTYILQSGDTNLFKIGHGNTRERLAACQTGNPQQLNMVASFSGGKPLEGFLHEMFKERRTINEWFSFDSRDDVVQQVWRQSERYRELVKINPNLKPAMLAALAKAAR